MNKKLLFLAIFGAAVPVVHAQGNVILYGTADTGYAHVSGKDTYMTHNNESALGVRGTEDLGHGYRAFFQLEKRLNLKNGSDYGGNPDISWYGGANVGIATPAGSFRLGRVDELPTETLRRLDPFNQDSIASMTLSTQRSTHIDNTIRFDSLEMAGLKLGATYSLGRNTKGSDRSSAFVLADADNDGYAGSIVYENGPTTLLGNWSRVADSNRSSSWNIGGAYAFGRLRLSLAYEKTHDRGWLNGIRSLSENSGVADSSLINGVTSTMDNWILGLNYRLERNTFKAAFNYVRLKNVAGATPDDGGDYWDSHSSANLKKYAIGYTYDLSKSTSLYGMLAYTDYANAAIASFFNGSGYHKNHVTGMQVGITHNF